MTFTHALSTNNYGTAKFIVSSSAANGTHTTIATALTSASSGDTIFIRPGTYTENLTLKAGVNLAAYDCDALTPNVTISGTCTLTVAGTVAISGIRLQTNSANLLAVTGSAASVVWLTNCYLNCTNNTGISFTSSDAGATIHIERCLGNIGTTGISLFTASSAGQIGIDYTSITNSGGSTTASTSSATLINVTNSNFNVPFTTSSTGAVNFNNVVVAVTNTTCITTAGTAATNTISNGQFVSGTASAISVGSGTTLAIFASVINSSNTNAITGAGTLVHSGLSFASSSLINTTTVTNNPFGRTQSFTPVLAFGGSTTAFAYTTQIGYCALVGNIAFINIDILLSTKGSGTGNVTLSGLPFTSLSTGTTGVCNIIINQFYNGSSLTNFNGSLSVDSGATTGLFIVNNLSTGANNVMTTTNTTFNNNTGLRLSGFYFVT